VAATAQAASPGSALTKLGFTKGQVVQELGYDTDADDDLRFAIEDLTTTELEDEDYGDVADAVLIWFRGDDEEDLVDRLVDGLTTLAEQGFLVLCTPKAGRVGEVQASDIEESAVTAGLHTAGSANVSPQWTATRLVSPKSQRR